jgi:intracellular protein transport protein USO1
MNTSLDTSNDPDQPQSAGQILLAALIETPLPGRPFDPYRPLFACLLLSHLIRNSEVAKKIAREISLTPVEEDNGSAVVDDDGDREGLVQIIVGNLMLAQREQAECANRRAKDGAAKPHLRDQVDEEETNWNRVMVGYLILLCTWLWDSPKTIKEFLNESSNLQVVSTRP